MASRTEVAQQFIEVQRSRDAAKIDELAAVLADNAVMAGGRRGDVSGKDAIIDRLKNPPQRGGGGGGGGGFGGGGGGGGMMGQINWEAPVEEGSVVKIKGTLSTPNPMFSGLTWKFTFDDQDKISKIERERA